MASLTGVQVNYQAVGSGAGITAITNNTVDFGASDAIMTSAQVAAAQAANGTLLTIPTTMGAVAIAYNLNTMGSKPTQTQRYRVGEHISKNDNILG